MASAPLFERRIIPIAAGEALNRWKRWRCSASSRLRVAAAVVELEEKKYNGAMIREICISVICWNQDLQK